MNYYLILLLVVYVYMTIWFGISVYKRRNDVADIAWGLGFAMLAWVSFLLSDGFDIRGIIVSILVTVWGVRLSWHIYKRNRGKPEDYRYLAWRKKWGKLFYLRSYVQVYLLQGMFLFLISIPVLLINESESGALGIFDILGAMIWVTGFLFESVGDAQLSKFMNNPANKGKILQSGLWRYTRHPNYFGEVLQWWGIWAIALSVPWGWVGVIGPLTITTLILFVSGIPLLEKKMEKNPEFLEYKKRTSMFIPLPPRK